MSELKSFTAWDRTVRVFHWVNVLCMLGLIAVGTVILNAGALGVPDGGKILLKTVHVWIGYVFAINLLWRLVWAFIGSPRARWRAILPGGRGYLGELRRYFAAPGGTAARQYLGHNPLGRIAIGILLLLLLSQAVTGLVLAGTDLFYPPLGSWIAGWIAAPGVDPATLVPYAREMYEESAYEAMRAFRKPFITVHYYGFYALLGFALLHVVAVVVTELRDGGSLVSAMITGRKALKGQPADRD
ncbi:MAG: cytochrome b/b6 domain-containing protein [Xanthomonadales bacterium]|nr:cytochrome b/b6 domain-containing protein [Xanthomonadales bacterium]